MPKAIKITDANKKVLELKFEMEDGLLDDSVGYNLVSDFGDHGWGGTLTDERLKEFFNVGVPLNNDWFEITFRSHVA